jgi:hypothetical protein
MFRRDPHPMLRAGRRAAAARDERNRAGRAAAPGAV